MNIDIITKETDKHYRPVSLTKYELIYLAIIISVGFVLRYFFLNQVMRYDESFTFLNYVNRDFFSLFSYTHPNNHILHTIFVKMTTDVFGIAPGIQRLPAFIAGLLCIPVTFIVCRSLIPGKSGYFAAICVAIFPYLVLFSTNARGYTLMVLTTLVLVFLCIRYHDRINTYFCFQISIITALGMLIMPTMAMVASGLYLWTFLMVVNAESLSAAVIRFLIPVSLFTILFTGLFYLPSILITGGLDHIVNNRFIISTSWIEFTSNFPFHIALVSQELFRDIPSFIIVFASVLIAVSIIYTIKEGNIKLLILLPCVIIGSIFVLLLKQRIPYVRTWIFLIPFLLILADAGFTYIIRDRSMNVHQVLLLLIIICSITFSYRLVKNDTITNYPDTGLFRDAPVIAGKLKSLWTPGDKLYALIPADWPVKFYLFYYVSQEGLNKHKKTGKSEYIVEDRENYRVTDISKLPVEKLYDTGKSALYRIK